MSIADKLANAKTSTWLLEGFNHEQRAELKTMAEMSAVIQRRRRELGMSQADLAKKLGVSQGLVSRWENGEENLTWSTIVKIADGLDLEAACPFKKARPKPNLIVFDITQTTGRRSIMPTGRRTHWEVADGT